MVSILIPVYNEIESIWELYNELTSVLKHVGQDYEILFVDDGSTDNSGQLLSELYMRDPKHVVCAEMRSNFGKAVALQVGFELARGEIVISMDGDLQDDPKEIVDFIAKINEGYDLVCGWKQHKWQESWLRNYSSRFYNFWVNRFISPVRLHDYNSGYKAYKADVARTLNLYGQLHRFIPIFLAWEGYRVTEIPVAHRLRKFGKSKYGLMRFLHGFLDMITVLFMTKFKARPLHFFGYVGICFFGLGFFGAVHLLYVQLILGEAIGSRPLLVWSMMFMVVGVQTLLTGLLGEQITSLIHRDEAQHKIRKITRGAQ